MGCRQRVPQAELLRVVVDRGSTGSLVVPDPDRRRSGRGAYLHPTRTCLELAVQRRALSRALRVTEPVEAGEVAREIERRESVAEQ